MLWFSSTRHTWRTQTLISPDTPQHTYQEHDTLWHVTFPDTSRSDLGFAECRGISRSLKFHEIAYFTQCQLMSGLRQVWGVVGANNRVTRPRIKAKVQESFHDFRTSDNYLCCEGSKGFWKAGSRMQDCCSHCGSIFHGFVCFGILCVYHCHLAFTFHQEEMTFNHNEWHLLRDSRDTPSRL